jgi:hypothetical protein
MNTAPVATSASVTVAPGVVVDTSMSPEQRFQAILKANVQPHQLGIGHTDHNVAGMSAAVANPPPSPKALEAANKPGAVAPQGNPSPARLADFEAEMQAKGLMVRPDGSTHVDGAADPAIIEKLTARYRSLHKDLIAGRNNPGKAAELRAAYERDLKRAVEGRPVSEFELPLELPKPKAAPAPATPPTKPGWQSHIEDREWVGLEHLTLNDTHGFTIPRWVDGQRVHVSTFGLLRDAKAAGVTQAQVNAVLRQHAVRAGWVKT